MAFGAQSLTLVVQFCIFFCNLLVNCPLHCTSAIIIVFDTACVLCEVLLDADNMLQTSHVGSEIAVDHNVNIKLQHLVSHCVNLLTALAIFSVSLDHTMPTCTPEIYIFKKKVMLVN